MHVCNYSEIGWASTTMCVNPWRLNPAFMAPQVSEWLTRGELENVVGGWNMGFSDQERVEWKADQVQEGAGPAGT